MTRKNKVEESFLNLLTVKKKKTIKLIVENEKEFL